MVDLSVHASEPPDIAFYCSEAAIERIPPLHSFLMEMVF